MYTFLKIPEVEHAYREKDTVVLIEYLLEVDEIKIEKPIKKLQ